METLAGRHDFDPELYRKNDAPGKAKAIKILAQSKLYKAGGYNILNPFEDKQCGDVKIQYTHDNSILAYEIENAGLDTDRFERNFKFEFSTVNVPMKNLALIPNGFFMAVDGKESEFVDIPKRLYLVKVKYVTKSPTSANVNIFSNGKLENFYKVPSYLVKRYKWDEEKGIYIRVYP